MPPTIDARPVSCIHHVASSARTGMPAASSARRVRLVPDCESLLSGGMTSPRRRSRSSRFAHHPPVHPGRKWRTSFIEQMRLASASIGRPLISRIYCGPRRAYTWTRRRRRQAAPQAPGRAGIVPQAGADPHQPQPLIFATAAPAATARRLRRGSGGRGRRPIPIRDAIAGYRLGICR